MATDTIIGNYRIEERIGRGGMGVVYRGHHNKLPREVAIKSISPRTAGNDLRRLKYRFEREAFVQSQLDHPGIVKIYDYIVAEQTYYIVMELVDGRSLAQLLSLEVRSLPLERALYLFDQILTAVAYAHSFNYKDEDGAPHRGIIHRDLKPHNILVTPDDLIKITDFGIVKLVGSENTDTFGAAYGSPRYVSPEQADGTPVDQRSDIYSLGVILYEMLTGAPPFGNDDEPLTRTEILLAHKERVPRPPSEINREITPEVEGIILRALEKDPIKRFATANDFLQAIRLARVSDAESFVKEEQAVSNSPREVGIHELKVASSGETARQSYVTQPIPFVKCVTCGTETEDIEEHCAKCGAELDASHATANLARQDAFLRSRRRVRRFFFVLFALALFVALSAYMRWHRAPAVQSVTNGSNSAAFNTPSTNESPTTLIELSPARVVVDSSFEGYTEKPLTDGVTDVRRIGAMRYNAGNWASAETPVPHWIEVHFAQPVRLSAVYVYWGFDRNHFVPSQRVELETPDERGAWRTMATLEPGTNFDRSAFEFVPMTTESLRIRQPAEEGPKNRPFVMWVREVKFFGIADTPAHS